jgi:hypothetical protein
MADRVIPFVIAVDVEPDERPATRQDSYTWSGVEPTVALLESWRERLSTATGRPARLSWFWRADPQVAEMAGDAAWGLRTFRAMRERTSGLGDEHGVHPHAWRIDGTGRWVHDHADRSWVLHCVDTALTTYRRETGRRCRVARLGERWLDPDVYRLFRRRGVRIDLSVEPGEPSTTHLSTAPLPDYSQVPRGPYRPQEDDITARGRARLGPVIMPLSSIVGEAPEGGGARLRTLQHWQLDAPELLTELLDRRPAYVAIASHTSVGVIDAFRERLVSTLEALARHPLRSSIVVTTPTHALSILGVRPGRRLH